jgi:hypothetical protein
MKPTAVEWYEKEINFLLEKYEAKEISKRDFITMKHNLFYPAKEMEKQQLIDCGNSCAIKQVIHNRKLDLMDLTQLMEFSKEENITFGEQYYNETFNK